jgi:hypothetical protein
MFMSKPQGRPRKGKDERRENVLRIRLTEHERKELDGAADAKSIDTSTWARMTLLESARADR